MKPNPFVVTFDDDADGGPDHFIYLLRDFSVALYKDGDPLVVGQVLTSAEGTISLATWDEEDSSFSGPTVTYDLWDGSFDELRYL